jgi:hypothetical protein
MSETGLTQKRGLPMRGIAAALEVMHHRVRDAASGMIGHASLFRKKHGGDHLVGIT